MKHSPRNLSWFFLAVTIYRLAVFMAVGMALGWVGQALAIGNAVGVYVASYFFGRLSGWRKWLVAMPALAFFWTWDTAFNMLEVVRTLSTANFVPNSANFLGMASADIRWLMQWAGLAIGICPSTAVLWLGLLQGTASEIDFTDKASILWQWQVAILAKFGYKQTAIETNETVILPAEAENQPKITGKTKMIAKSSLSAEQKSLLPTLTDGQIVALYGIKPRTARKWRQDVKNNTW